MSDLNNTITVNGKQVNKEEFDVLQKKAETGAIKLTKLDEGQYKKLDKMKG
jgi:hypothetical protein